MKPLDDVICVESLKQVIDIFGGKWTFLILGELHTGAKHFNALQRSLDVSTRSLSLALKSLESHGVIERTVITSPTITVEYSLTEKGKDFEVVFVEMNKWGYKWLNTSNI